MALRNIRVDEDPILRKRARDVSQFDDRLHLLVEDLVETMKHADGVGLAAPQVGILKRVVIVDVDQNTEPMVLVNPEILSSDGEQLEIEGCLSLPGRSGLVKRPQRVKVAYQDVAGVSYVLEGEDLMARVLCHEIDHLDGILYTDKMVQDTSQNE